MMGTAQRMLLAIARSRTPRDSTMLGRTMTTSRPLFLTIASAFRLDREYVLAWPANGASSSMHDRSGAVVTDAVLMNRMRALVGRLRATSTRLRAPETFVRQ